MSPVAKQISDPIGLEGRPAGKDMSRWLGDGGMPILAEIGVSFDDYGIEDDDRAGWATAHGSRSRWPATRTASSRPVSMRSCSTRR